MKDNKQQQTATNIYCNYADEVNRYNSLTAQEEQYLWNRVEEGDKKAFDTIIKACLKYVLACSWKNAHNKISIDDLISEGNLALMKASQKYDRTKGARFYTYAQYEVEGAIKKKVGNALKQGKFRYEDIDRLQDKDANQFLTDEDVSWCNCLSKRIQNYLDKIYYSGAGKLFLDTMLMTTEGFTLTEAASKQNVMPEFIRGMKRDVKSYFRNRKRFAE